MENKITDDDLNLSVDSNDRLGDEDYGKQAYAGPVRGVGGVKAIFNAENQKRLWLYALVGVLLFGALIWVFFSVDAQQVPQGGTGRVESGSVMTKESAAPSYLQRQEAEHYNNVILPQQQAADPSAHPVIVTETADVNPFERKASMREPSRVSEVGIESGRIETVATNSEAPVDYRAMDDLIKSLIEHEGAMTPEPYSVEWSYRPVSNVIGSATSTQSISSASAADGEAQVTGVCANPATRAATMYMATTDLALNSDVGGPVSLTIRNGKLRGAQLIGSFERKEKLLRMELNRIVTRDHTLPVSAIGLDMDTTLNAVQGDVDSHLMYRYGWWGLGTALKAVGKAAELNADTQVTVTNGAVVESTAANSSREIKLALGSLGEELGSTFQDRINRPITVSLKVGDEVGVFFMDDVCLPSGSGSGY